MNKVLIIITSLILSYAALAEDRKISGDDKFHSLIEKFKKDHEIFEKFFEGSSMMKHFEEEMDKMMKEFKKDYKGHIPEHFKRNEAMDDNSFKWIESDTDRTLIVNIESEKDSPMDIKIENDLIKIEGKAVRKEEGTRGSGKTQYKSYSSYTFSRQFRVPDDVDANQAEIKSVDGKINIVFPKKSVTSISTPKKSKDPQKSPLKFKKNDLTI